jgi:hypothetical protein
MRAVVTGMIATYPVGGVVWDYGQYAVGLEKLGWEVYYLEDTGSGTYDPEAGLYGEDPSYGARFLSESLAALSPALGKRWHFRAMNGETFGLEAQAFREAVESCDLFLNVSGSALLRPEYAKAPRKVLIDTDPGWNQFVNYPKWDQNPGWLGTLGFRAHDYFFTYAERIGKPDCPLPDFGLAWQPTRPPVIPECWGPKPPADTWTTVMTWDNFRRPIEYGGVTYGTKEKEFVRIESLPGRVATKLEIAAGGDHAPRKLWQEQGWSVVDSHAVSQTPEAYRQYIESSRGEFSVAKNVYAGTRCGWFSCRSVCYLAAGRPVVLQDTGFSEVVPTGEGLVPFTDLDSAVRAIRAVEGSYSRHSAAARRVAEEVFGYQVVLGGMLERVGLG